MDLWTSFNLELNQETKLMHNFCIMFCTGLHEEKDELEINHQNVEQCQSKCIQSSIK